MAPNQPSTTGEQPKIRFCVILPALCAGRMTQKRILGAHRRSGGCAATIRGRCRDSSWRRRQMDPQIDLVADLNAEDDEGLGWSTMSDARDAAQIRPRRYWAPATATAKRW